MNARRDTLLAGQFALCLYCAFLFGALPLVFRNNYIDISTFKYVAFSTVTFAFAGVLAVWAAVRFRFSLKLNAADAAMFIFLLANALACATSSNPRMSFFGATGRKTGLEFILCVFLCYAMLRSAWYALPIMKAFLIISGTFVSLLGILNFLGFDPLNMYINLVPIEHEMFISTIGNRNFFSGFLTVSLAICASVCVFSGHRLSRLCWPCAAIMFAAAVAARSDLMFAGLGVAMLMLLLLALRSRAALFRCLNLAAVAAVSVILIRLLFVRFEAQALSMYPSIPMTILTAPWALYALIAAAIIALTAAALVKRKVQSLARAYRFFRALLAALLMGAVVLVLASSLLPSAPESLGALKIDDNFGNYRGYIWIRALQIFNDFSPLQKLIGCGPDMFGIAAYEALGDDMKLVTGARFDNCHNEYLQYLLTSGIIGLGAYLAALGAALHALIRCIQKNDRAAYPLFVAIAGYAAQSLFNINQSITTPYVFALIALSVSRSYAPQLSRHWSRP